MEALTESAQVDLEKFSSQRVREALRALLALNDGELSSLLGGSKPSEVATNLSPSTLLFLSATQNTLHKLKKVMPFMKDSSLPGDFVIAKRKKTSSKQRTEDPDSLLNAITHISSYAVANNRDIHILTPDAERLKQRNNFDTVKSRSRRSHTKQKKSSHRRLSRKFHPSFWFRPRGKNTIS